jgi:hypothetical protein
MDDPEKGSWTGTASVSMGPTDLLTLSVNKVTVSVLKTTESGAPVIQVGDNVEPGDSGGSALWDIPPE